MDYRELVHKLIATSLIHRFHITKAAQQVGLYYGQPMLLEYINEHKYCAQKELAAALHISPASVATSLKRLEKAGLVKRTADSNDIRKNCLSLTDNGIRAISNFRSTCDNTDKEMFRGFSEEECMVLQNLLERLYDNLNTENLSHSQLKAELEKSKKITEEENKQ